MIVRRTYHNNIPGNGGSRIDFSLRGKLPKLLTGCGGKCAHYSFRIGINDLCILSLAGHYRTGAYVRDIFIPPHFLYVCILPVNRIVGTRITYATVESKTAAQPQSMPGGYGIGLS